MDVLLWLLVCLVFFSHYIDVIMTTMAFQITSLTIVYLIVYTDQRKQQSSASLAFVRGIHRDQCAPFWPFFKRNSDISWPPQRLQINGCLFNNLLRLTREKHKGSTQLSFLWRHDNEIRYLIPDFVWGNTYNWWQRGSVAHLYIPCLSQSYFIWFAGSIWNIHLGHPRHSRAIIPDMRLYIFSAITTSNPGNQGR